jgi:hypothetical protein
MQRRNFVAIGPVSHVYTVSMIERYKVAVVCKSLANEIAFTQECIAASKHKVLNIALLILTVYGHARALNVRVVNRVGTVWESRCGRV